MLRTRAPRAHSSVLLHRNCAFDLHVLSTPPAFALSRDQTLILKVGPRHPAVGHTFLSAVSAGCLDAPHRGADISIGFPMLCLSDLLVYPLSRVSGTKDSLDCLPGRADILVCRLDRHSCLLFREASKVFSLLKPRAVWPRVSRKSGLLSLSKSFSSLTLNLLKGQRTLGL